MPAASTKLKRMFSGITLTTNDLRTIAHYAGQISDPVAMRANTYRLSEIEQITEVLATDVVVDRLTMVAFSPDENSLEFTFESGYIMVQGEFARPETRTAFDAIVVLLEAKPRNGFNCCVLEVSPAQEAWIPPARDKKGWFASKSTGAAADKQPASDRPSGRSPARKDVAADGVLATWWKRLSRTRDQSRQDR